MTEMQRLAPAARWVRLFSGLVGTLFLSLFLFVGDMMWASRQTWWPLEPGTATLVLVPTLVLWDIVYPFLWYRCWRFAVRERDLLVRYGVAWRLQRSVPLDRIQHVDIKAGPIDRAFGLVSLSLFTAGSGDEDVEIPGLEAKAAEDLRERLLDFAVDEPAAAPAPTEPPDPTDERSPDADPA
jgi:membrane protein YdbS with pleckstrin-like domain